MAEATGGVTSAPCPHGRASWASCPHCLGVNRLPSPPAPPRRYSFTRDQLIEALGTPEMWPLAATLSVGIPAGAESMADAIIGAREDGESAAREGAPRG